MFEKADYAAEYAIRTINYTAYVTYDAICSPTPYAVHMRLAALYEPAYAALYEPAFIFLR